VDLGTRAHAFWRGHRVMVQVQSTWFPLYDRNPQSWVENIFQARPQDFIKARHRVLRSKVAPSSVMLTVSP
jgi:predicted acyl esterase